MKNGLITLITFISIALTVHIILMDKYEWKALILENTGSVELSATSTSESGNISSNFRNDVANPFSDAVGKFLKANHPARVEGVVVKVESNGEELSLTYKANIQKCSEEEAHFHFDHRGLLTPAKSSRGWLQNSVKTQVQEGVPATKAKFEKAFGKTDVYLDFDSDIDDLRSYGLAEAFFCSRKISN
jgi:hypothetical protein